MIPPVFITLHTIGPRGLTRRTRVGVSHIVCYLRDTAQNYTVLVTVDHREQEHLMLEETPEEIDELIRKATDPYTAAFHRLFTPSYHVHTNS